MTNEQTSDLVTSSVLAWTSQGARLQHTPDDEVPAEVDEPPDPVFYLNSAHNRFTRTVVPRIADNTESLLTKALHESGEDNFKTPHRISPTRRRSLNSNISLASTADLTSDTGLTSPARTNTPSPPLPVISLAAFSRGLFGAKREITSPGGSGHHGTSTSSGPGLTQPHSEKVDNPVELLQKKRRISFACNSKPDAAKPSDGLRFAEPAPTKEEKLPRKTCIKFACPAKPVSRNEKSQVEQQECYSLRVQAPTAHQTGPPMTLKPQSPAPYDQHQRSPTTNSAAQGPTTVWSSKYLTADANDLNAESSRFHEFASDEPLQEDWIRQNLPPTSARLTIDDTLRKENEIRRLGKEVEEEDLEEEEEADLENDEDLDLLDEIEDDEDVEDEAFDSQSDYGSDDVASDGYNTDNEIGFAESDDEDDGDLQFWTPSPGLALRLSADVPIQRRPSTGGKSDYSSSEEANTSKKTRQRSRRIKFRPGTPELPDSTDFVCGTLDEDRVLEDAYISCMAVKRREKLHLIPQDIDPSFPTSEPEDEDIELHRRGHDSDEQLWFHGELEDIHHTKNHDGEPRKARSGHASPKRYHSPPPKARVRSPRRLFDIHSPRRLCPPPPPGRAMRSPPASLVQGGQHQNAQFKSLAFRPGLTHTKSLPRAPALFPQHIKNQRRMSKPLESGGHVRGAIDIVKGLEQKRQRRREKFKEKYFQKHNDKARKGQLPQQRPQPGKGAERMREIGLLSAGKLDPDQYVLSI